MLLVNRHSPFPRNVHFIHNWRCAGTSVNSLLSSNFYNSYIKIGHPFTSYGWPEDYRSHRDPLLTVEQLRKSIITASSSRNSVIVGGHTFLGLERFFSGRWDIWLNYREPIARLNSGILRFYANSRKKSSASHGHLIDLESSQKVDFNDPHTVDLLLSTSLLRESNGISRRLAASAITPSFNLASTDNIELIPIVSQYRYSEPELYEAALQNITALDFVFNSDYLHQSFLALEKCYSLPGPLINPFSDLRHNSVELTGLRKNDKRLLSTSRHILEKHTRVDRKIIPLLNQKFADQINTYAISAQDLLVRELIHKKPIFSTNWFDSDGLPLRDNVIDLMTKNILTVCLQEKELSSKVIDTILSWTGLSQQVVESIRKCKSDNYNSIL